jgi:hypothetical protein
MTNCLAYYVAVLNTAMKSVFDTDQALLQFISLLANTEHHPNRKFESRLIFLPCSNTLAYSAQFVNYNGEKFYKRQQIDKANKPMLMLEKHTRWKLHTSGLYYKHILMIVSDDRKWRQNYKLASSITFIINVLRS